MKYKAILLDLDNTLYEYEPNHQLAINNVLEFFAKNFSFSIAESKNLFNQARKFVATQIPNTAASHNRLLYFQTMCEMVNIKASLHALKLYNIYWDSFLNNMKMFDGAKEFFEYCQKNKIQIALVTDLTAHIQYRKIEKLEIADYLDFIVTSEETGIDKPDKSMFLRAIDKLNLSNSDVCMIGDNYDKDILGAKALKIDSIWLNSNHKSGTELKDNICIVNNFSQINKIFS